MAGHLQQSPAQCSIKQWLDHATKQHREHEKSEARIESRILLTHVLGKPSSYLYTWPDKELEPSEIDRVNLLLQRRLQGEPIAYILGVREFWSLDFKVTPDVLIPRQETEALVELCLDYFSHLSELSQGSQQELQKLDTLKLLELGTGSGAISISVANERPHLNITATDVSNFALDIAKENAETHQCHNIEFKLGSWYQCVTETAYDMIVSNPPYVAEMDEHLSKGDLPFEPKVALSSGENGLNDIKHIVTSALNYLKAGGRLALEHGYDQAQSIQKLMSNVGFINVTTIQDHSGTDRITTGIKSI